jgi:phosphatidylinositol alpha 1,6-mannosyltransferase
LRRRWAPGGEVVVGFVGRLAPEKRVDLLAHLHGIPGTRMVVVGDGPARAALQQQLPHATFTGFLSGEDLAQAYASMDVFVHTGTSETFCQTVQEALASGLAVIAPAAGGPMDLVDHGTNGWLWPTDAPELIRSMVSELVHDAALLQRMRAAARPSVQSNTWASLVGLLEDYYLAVTGMSAVEHAA